MWITFIWKWRPSLALYTIILLTRPISQTFPPAPWCFFPHCPLDLGGLPVIIHNGAPLSSCKFFLKTHRCQLVLCDQCLSHWSYSSHLYFVLFWPVLLYQPVSAIIHLNVSSLQKGLSFCSVCTAPSIVGSWSITGAPMCYCNTK